MENELNINGELNVNDDELIHWGIKGMRWGVRRFQNKDGSLTPAGERRRAKLEGELENLGGKKGGSKGDSDGDSKSDSEAAPRRKTAAEMTDAELNKIVNRTRLENEYNRMYPEPPPVEKHPIMKKFINEAIVPAATNAGKKFIENALTQVGEKLLKGKVDPNSMEALTAIRDKLKIQTEIEEYKMGGKINWENMKKKQEYETNAQDRAAKMEGKGYQDAPDKAKKEREAAEAAAATTKAKRLESQRQAQNRSADDPVSKFINNVTETKKVREFVDTATDGTRLDSNDLNLGRAKTGKKVVDDYMDTGGDD